MNSHETIKLSFLGMKLECNKPGNKTPLILVILLTFFLVLVHLLSG